MYKVVVVGHGDFPSGIVSALELLVGKNENITSLNLNDERTHEDLENEMNEILKENERVIVFADLTGGAPHQISSRIILENKYSDNHYVISGISVGLALEIVMSTVFSEPKDDDVENIIKNAIEQNNDMVNYISTRMV